MPPTSFQTPELELDVKGDVEKLRASKQAHPRLGPPPPTLNLVVECELLLG